MINIVLFEPEIPQNTGNIMRTCIGVGATLHLIKPFGFSLDESSIKRSGAGYIENCNYIIYENFDEFVKNNPGNYYFLTRYGTQDYTLFDYSNPDENIYLIFGKESTGISKGILKKYRDKCLRIPINDKIRSLNLSNCVAIMVYEVLRQQKFLNLNSYDIIKGKDYIDK